MLLIEWGDPQTFWLNLTNLALGIVTLLALGILAASVAQELLARRRRSHEISGIDEEMRHMLHVHELGLTMADGGAPVNAPRTDAPANGSRK